MGEGFGLNFLVSVIKLCNICLDMYRKGYDGLVVGALVGHPLYVQQLDLCIRFLSGSEVLNGLENAVSTDLLLYSEEVFGAGVYDHE